MRTFYRNAYPRSRSVQAQYTRSSSVHAQHRVRWEETPSSDDAVDRAHAQALQRSRQRKQEKRWQGQEQSQVQRQAHRHLPQHLSQKGQPKRWSPPHCYTSQSQQPRQLQRVASQSLSKAPLMSVPQQGGWKQRRAEKPAQAQAYDDASEAEAVEQSGPAQSEDSPTKRCWQKLQA